MAIFPSTAGRAKLNSGDGHHTTKCNLSRVPAKDYEQPEEVRT
jgi:hypothetical protein